MASPKVPKDYQATYLQCRTFGHVWRVSEKFQEPGAFYHFVLICHECHTKRTDLIYRRTGMVKGRRYDYPDGYRMDEVKGLKRTTYRLEFIRRGPGND